MTSGASRRTVTKRFSDTKRSRPASATSPASSPNIGQSMASSTSINSANASGSVNSSARRNDGITEARTLSGGLRYLGLAQDRVDAVVGGDVFELGVRVQDQAVAQHGRRKHLDVVRNHEVAAFAGGAGTGALQQRNRSARRSPQVHRGVRPRARQHVGDVREDATFDTNRAQKRL